MTALWSHYNFFFLSHPFGIRWHKAIRAWVCKHGRTLCSFFWWYINSGYKQSLPAAIWSCQLAKQSLWRGYREQRTPVFAPARLYTNCVWSNALFTRLTAISHKDQLFAGVKTGHKSLGSSLFLFFFFFLKHNLKVLTSSSSLSPRLTSPSSRANVSPATSPAVWKLLPSTSHPLPPRSCC